MRILGDEKTGEEKGCEKEVSGGKENGGSSCEEPPAIFRKVAQFPAETGSSTSTSGIIRIPGWAAMCATNFA